MSEATVGAELDQYPYKDTAQFEQAVNNQAACPPGVTA